MQTDMAAYQGLSRAQLSFEYLHTNSTTHEFLFGALAEMLDNSRDAGATCMDIFTVENDQLRGGYMLCFLDDGVGMSPDEAANVIQFGKSTKRNADLFSIGQYGNGLKSGSMRIGKDFILFTKKGDTMTCLFLSRTFHEQEKIDEVIVPLPSFDVKSKKTISKSPAGKLKHRIEMDLILKYSPFKTEEEVFEQFASIKGRSGTLVIIYNLKLLDSGEPELDIYADPTDVLMAGDTSADDDGVYPERRSFRAYAAVLYVEPKMKIYIQNKKVRTKHLASCLHKPRKYKYTSTRFKTRSEMETAKAVNEAKMKEEKAREAESTARDLEKKTGHGDGKEKMAILRKAQIEASEKRKEANQAKDLAAKKQKSLKEPKTLSFVYGMNIGNRKHDGVFIYNCSRLIRMYEKVGPQLEGGVNCSGVLGYVDVPYIVLEPTHNKQNFEDRKEFRLLLKAMGEHMAQYWKDTSITSQGVTRYWEDLGYVSSNWKDMPSNESKYVRKRAMQLQTMIQCDSCLKWRLLQFSSSNINKVIEDDWTCSQNPDPTHNRCSAAEQKLNIPIGHLKKDNKSAEEKKKNLKEDIKKKQEKLNSMEKFRSVTSRHDLDNDEQDTVVVTPRYQESRIRKTPTASVSRPVGTAQPVFSNNKSSKPVGKASPVISTSGSHTHSVQYARSTSAPSTPSYQRSSSQPATPKTVPSKPKYTVKSKTQVNSRKSQESKTAQTKKSVSPASRALKRSRDVISDDTTSTSSSDDESEKSVEPIKKKKNEKIRQSPAKSIKEIKEIQQDVDSSNISSCEGEAEEIGCKVEAYVNCVWHSGIITHSSKSKVKVKFDDYPKDKFDKWYERTDDQLRFLEDNSKAMPVLKLGKRGLNLVKEASEPEKTKTTEEPKKVVKVTKSDDEEKADTKEADTTMMPTTTTQHGYTKEQIDELVTKAALADKMSLSYRKCLRYFLPPNWIMTKDDINKLSLEEVSEFKLEQFFDSYEKGLRDLVGTFQHEAFEKKKVAEAATTKLTSLRKMIAQLLKSINEEEINIDEDTDGEVIEELLAACVRQAMQE
ncbi:ATPase MORC2-like isoform X2 [Anneissia japonica]|uniref:ATPase MORC2-like isoform X2 n=1 Tax=Anneissia japonica TaxID=1529436 RepID=UPI0014258EAC|nr:ATPase MORC2-like isoform X2 [Anneissia japonica]